MIVAEKQNRYVGIKSGCPTNYGNIWVQTEQGDYINTENKYFPHIKLLTKRITQEQINNDLKLNYLKKL